MNLTENLLPGDGADRKPAVGKNIPEIYCTTVEMSPEIRKPAIRAVAARAHDAADARDLLEHLGLINPLTPTPTWKRANTPKATS